MFENAGLTTASKVGADTPTGLSGILAQVPAMMLIFPSPKIPIPVAFIPCMYKPEKLKFTKSMNWDEEPMALRNSPMTTFVGGNAETLSLRLILDSTKAGFLGVQGYIFILKQLMQVPPILLNQPPLVMFMWGMLTSSMSFIKSMEYEYTFFDPSGRALRAEVNLTLVEYDMGPLAPQNPTSRSEPRRTWVVSEGQTLDWIAYQEYGESAAWRHIAKANHLMNPMELKAGQVLKLPARQ